MLLELVMAWGLLKGSIYSTNSVEKGAIGIRDAVLTRTIYRVYKDSPAELSGIKPGDKIFKVLDDAGSDDITGAPGTFVRIWIKRSDLILEFYVQRAPESSIRRGARSVDRLYTDRVPEPKPCPQSTSPSSPLLPASSGTMEPPPSSPP